MLENSPANYEVTTNINVTDPDTTANLSITIIWEDSYATKSGQEVANKTLYHK